MEKIERGLEWADKHPFRCAAALFLFHFSVSATLYAIACSPFLAGMHNGHGLWNFSVDSHLFNKWALHGMRLLQAGDISSWWHEVPKYPHVKWIALSYFLLTPHPIAFAPVNALTWVGTVFAVYAIAKLMVPGSLKWAALGTAIFALMPSYFLQSTQLLKDPLYVLGVSVFLLGMTRLLSGRPGWCATVVFLVVGFKICASLRPYMLPVFALSVFVMMLVAIFRVPKARILALAMLGIMPIMVYRNIVAMEYFLELPDIVTQHSPSQIQYWFDRVVHNFQAVRKKFYGYGAGSTVDRGVDFKHWQDLLRYIPRAMEIGLLSPFPSSWVRPDSSSAWNGARLLSGIEMLVLYTLLIGVPIFAMRRSIPLRLRISILGFSLFCILLLGMEIPIVGMIYRMRYAYIMPMILGGVSGWQVLLKSGSLCRLSWRESEGDKSKGQ